MKTTRTESRFAYLLKGGAKPRRSFALMMALVLVGMLSLAGVVSADNAWKGTPPTTANGISGTVTGDVDVKFANTWNASNPVNNDYTTATFSGLHTANVKFARLYVVAYTASMTENWQGTETITLSRSGEDDVVLANAQPLDLNYVNTTGTTCTAGLSAPFITTGTGLCRVTSDYVSIFDVKDYITDDTMTLSILTTNVSGRFDGRIKEAKLVYGWDSPEVKYYINEGDDPSTYYDPGYQGVTTFSDVPTDGITSAILYTDDIASANGSYAWGSSTNTITPTTLAANSYARLNQFTINPATVSETPNNFYYDRAGTNNWYKIAVAVLKLTY